MTPKTITTEAGRTYTVAETIGANGEITYGVEMPTDDGIFPIGSLVIHPDYNAERAKEHPGLVSVQFGKGSAMNRHERTSVPALGSANTPFVVGHQLVDPLRMAGSQIFGRALMGALTGTGTKAVEASSGTFARTTDLVRALVELWRKRPDLDVLTKQHAAFVGGESPWTEQHANARGARIGELQCNVISISERIADRAQELEKLTSKVGPVPADGSEVDAAFLLGSISALSAKREEIRAEIARLAQ